MKEVDGAICSSSIVLSYLADERSPEARPVRVAVRRALVLRFHGPLYDVREKTTDARRRRDEVTHVRGLGPQARAVPSLRLLDGLLPDVLRGP